MYTKKHLLTFLVASALALAAGAQAANYPDPQDRSAPDQFTPADQAQVDPPSRVARLARLDGNVSFTPAGESDWVQAQVNRPIVIGDKLWTDHSARAELQIGSATVVLDHDSNFDFLNLDDQLAQMELTNGAMSLDVRRLRANETFEVDTPTIAFVANRVGNYRIDVDPQGAFTVVTVNRGGGEAVGEGGKRIAVEQGQSVRFRDSQLVDYVVNTVRANRIDAGDDFDRYATQRVERYSRVEPRGYVSTDVVGYEDLYDNGTWEDSADYGHVWYPTGVAVDWAPYHDGRWTWVDPWGWTWVDDAPWGFAPYHYGRWSYIGSRWGWVPGPLDIEPVYAPALVAFVGGGGFGVDISIGGPIGWFALGPRDVYFPGYRCGRDYFSRVNYGGAYFSATVMNNYYGAFSRNSVDYAALNYSNRNAPRAFSAMPATAFAAGRTVASSAVAVSASTVANARILPRATVAPTRASLVAGRGRAAAPPAAVVNRGVIAARQPASPRASFAQRQSLLTQNPGQPVNSSQLRSLAAQGGQARGRGANNVRVVGDRGNLQPARSAAGQADRATMAANNARIDSGSPDSIKHDTRSRAIEMNRSPARANAQYLRSAGFAHEGIVPGSERALNAQAGRSANDRGARVQDSARNSSRSASFARAPFTTERGRAASASTARNAAADRGSRGQFDTRASRSSNDRAVAQRSQSSVPRMARREPGAPNSRSVTSRQTNRFSARSTASSPNYRSEQRPAVRSRAPDYRSTARAFNNGPSQSRPQTYRSAERASMARSSTRPSMGSSRPSFQQRETMQSRAPMQSRASMQSRESMQSRAPMRSAPPMQQMRQAPMIERGRPHGPAQTASARQAAPRGGADRRRDKDHPNGG